MSARSRALAISLLMLAACVGRKSASADPVAAQPSAWRDWMVTTTAVDRLLADGRVDRADSTLAEFQRRWPGTPESEEGAWWRLLRQAEKAEDSTSTSELVVRIDSLLTAAPASTHRGELMLLRRVAIMGQQLRSERAAVRAEREAGTATAKQRSDELEKTKAELELVKAELDRVRNRVTRRRP